MCKTHLMFVSNMTRVGQSMKTIVLCQGFFSNQLANTHTWTKQLCTNFWRTINLSSWRRSLQDQIKAINKIVVFKKKLKEFLFTKYEWLTWVWPDLVLVLLCFYTYNIFIMFLFLHLRHFYYHVIAWTLLETSQWTFTGYPWFMTFTMSLYRVFYWI